MDDPPAMKTKGSYKQWSEPESNMLVRLLTDAINQGFRDANGKFHKMTVDTRILAPLNKTLGINKTYNEYKNRMKILKGRYLVLADLLRFSSGFGWDPETKKFTASDEVWNDYLKAHPNKTQLRNESFEDFKDLRMLFGSNTATGRNPVGLGDSIDADTYQVRENDGTNDPSRVQIMDDAEEITYEETSVHDVFSSLERRRGGKLPQRKKARTDAFNSNKVLKALAPSYMAKPGSAVPRKIKDSTRFYPYFKDCVGAIDGTHILAMITGQESASYRNRKGQLSQNVLAACNFDLEFIYVLSGWEGSAHDAKVLHDALTRNTNKLIVPEEENDVEEADVHERDEDENNEEQLHGTQEQQRVLANNWRATIAANMWTDAMNMGS
ncbi:unnamed protein product [Arabidopsis arenosa]|uniref:Myb/SANT-like domain-containing protein n=1 Tax=Arabidopsis arenosa TaxID=38785 RepID=A0A8S2B1B8_ARAAE|nr:unnamed protein product [Arabidopsis arenosa]